MLPVDQFYRHSFEIWLATTVIFFGAGNVGYTLLEYRAAGRPLVSRLSFQRACSPRYPRRWHGPRKLIHFFRGCSHPVLHCCSLL